MTTARIALLRHACATTGPEKYNAYAKLDFFLVRVHHLTHHPTR